MDFWQSPRYTGSSLDGRRERIWAPDSSSTASLALVDGGISAFEPESNAYHQALVTFTR
jgi:hypothetical protein